MVSKERLRVFALSRRASIFRNNCSASLLSGPATARVKNSASPIAAPFPLESSSRLRRVTTSPAGAVGQRIQTAIPEYSARQPVTGSSPLFRQAHGRPSAGRGTEKKEPVTGVANRTQPQLFRDLPFCLLQPPAPTRPC